MAVKRKFVLNIYLLPLCIGLVLAQNDVIVEPREATVRNGQNVTLLCKSKGPLIYCRFEIPSINSINIRESSQTDDYSYYGNGLDAGDCGVRLNRVDLNYNGDVKCTMGYRDSDREGVGIIAMVVGVSPSLPQFETFNNQPLVKDNVFEDRCVVSGGRPGANISFFLDNEEIIQGVSPAEEYNQTDNVTVVRRLRFRISDEDDGKTLTCRAEHFAYPNGFEEKKVQLRVHYAPVAEPMKTIYGLELDRTAFVTVTIQSNPRPETHWNIDNNIQIHQGDTKEKYEAQAPKEIAEGKWNVTLVIDKLSLEDTQKEYKLTADNALGRQEYKIKISPSDAPISDLDMGAIIGIAVACILVIIVIGLVIAARATGRWCFAETSKDASNKTNSNDEENSNGLKTIGQQIVPFKQRLLGMVARARGKHCDDNQDVIPNKEENDEYNEKISTETAILEDDQKQTLDNKNSNQLIYAELDIKTMPEIVNRTAVEKKTNDNQEKTEYAEILYVSPQNN